MTQLVLDLCAGEPAPPPAHGFLDALGTVGSRLRAAIADMEIAEEELERAWPGRAGEPVGLFPLLSRPSAMHGMAPDLYRAHVRELVERACAGEDLALATRAELLAMWSHASIVAPPNAEGMAAIDRLLETVLPSMHDRLAGECGAPPREPWAGQAEEAIRAAQRRMRDETRRLPTAARPRRARRS